MYYTVCWDCVLKYCVSRRKITHTKWCVVSSGLSTYFGTQCNLRIKTTHQASQLFSQCVGGLLTQGKQCVLGYSIWMYWNKMIIVLMYVVCISRWSIHAHTNTAIVNNWRYVHVWKLSRAEWPGRLIRGNATALARISTKHSRYAWKHFVLHSLA